MRGARRRARGRPPRARAWRNTKRVPKRAAGGSRRRKSPSMASLSRCDSTTTTRPPSVRHARHACARRGRGRSDAGHASGRPQWCAGRSPASRRCRGPRHATPVQCYSVPSAQRRMTGSGATSAGARRRCAARRAAHAPAPAGPNQPPHMRARACTPARARPRVRARACAPARAPDHGRAARLCRGAWGRGAGRPRPRACNRIFQKGGQGS